MEAHGIVAASSGMNALGVPQTGSPALNNGTNLSSLCVGNLLPLCSDIVGHPRPPVIPWDIGAYEVAH